MFAFDYNIRFGRRKVCPMICCLQLYARLASLSRINDSVKLLKHPVFKEARLVSGHVEIMSSGNLQCRFNCQVKPLMPA